MKVVLLQLLLLVFLLTLAVADDCNEECSQTEYKSYIECIQKRFKRSIDCDNKTNSGNCQNCDCNFCVVNHCAEKCVGCCESTPPCMTRSCCHRTCHSRCKSLSCRNLCRRVCAEKLTAEGINITSSRGRHNVTTVIHLENTINNTNIIDIPINVNNTNFNNISTNFEDQRETELVQNFTENNNCCYVYSSKKCSRIDTPPYAKCVQYRKKVCGSVCVAPIIHEQLIQDCTSTSKGLSCQQHIMYIPQRKPVCSYQSVWPYVACGIPTSQNCTGCYKRNITQSFGCLYGCDKSVYPTGVYYTNRLQQYDNVNRSLPNYYKSPILPRHITSTYPYTGSFPVYVVPPPVDMQVLTRNVQKKTRSL